MLQRIEQPAMKKPFQLRLVWCQALSSPGLETGRWGIKQVLGVTHLLHPQRISTLVPRARPMAQGFFCSGAQPLLNSFLKIL